MHGITFGRLDDLLLNVLVDGATVEAVSVQVLDRSNDTNLSTVHINRVPILTP